MTEKALNKNILAIKNPDLSSEWHPTKNGALTSADFLSGSGKEVWWLGKCGHEWEAVISSRNRGRGCPICANRQLLKGYNDLATKNPALAKEWHPAKNGYFTPDMMLSGANEKVWWLCSVCNHEWSSLIYVRNKGHGCPRCSKRKSRRVQVEGLVKEKGSILKNNPELASEWHPVKNGDLTSDMFTCGSGEKVWWLCKKNHEWEAVIGSRNSGMGCPVCNREIKSSFPEQAIYYYLNKLFDNVTNSYKIDRWHELDIYIEEINLAIEYDGEAWHKNPEKDLKKNKICRNKKIHLIRVREENCPLLNDSTHCISIKSNSAISLEKAIRQIVEYIDKNIISVDKIDIDINRDTTYINNLLIHRTKENSLLLHNPVLAKEWHPVKNGKLNPDMITSSSSRRVWWLGTCDHEWQVSVDSRVFHKSGCPICANKQVLPGFNDLATLKPQIAKDWHPIKNNELKPTDVTPLTLKKVWWMCEKGHEWEASLLNRCKEANATKCPYCANKKVLVGYNDLATVNPKLAAEWHPTKNYNLTPEMVVAGSGKKVWWLCNKGHEWKTTVDHRNRGSGCSICRRNGNVK